MEVSQFTYFQQVGGIDCKPVSGELTYGLERLCKELNLPYRLRDLEIPEEACKLMASEAMKQTRLLVNNPRKIEESDAYNIYKSVW